MPAGHSKLPPMYNIHLLPATFGDSILIEYGSRQEPHYILIDGGPYYVFGGLLETIQRVAPGIKEIELLVVTHIDIDHIDGTVKMLNQSNLPFTIKEIWFNGLLQLKEAAEKVGDDSQGPLQGEFLTKLIDEKEIPHNITFFKGGPVCIYDYDKLPEIELEGGMKITLLAPGAKDLVSLIPVWNDEMANRDVDEEWEDEWRYKDEGDTLGDPVEDMQALEFDPDKSEANCSSIAFIATFDEKTCLFAADSPSHVLLASIQPMLDRDGSKVLKTDAWKLAHHGSKKSTQDSIMKKVQSKNILVSSDGKRYKHPDGPVLAKLLKHRSSDLTFYFNYRTKFNEMWDKTKWKNDHDYEAVYPTDADQPGITIEL